MLKLKYVFIICILMSFFSCSKSSSKENPYSPPNTLPLADPPQYGTPFSNVPSPQDASIYQVNIRSFSAEGNFKGIIARLDSIKALGINVIYLMPIYPVGNVKTVNSPYCVRDYLTVNEEFGSLTDLRTLIESAHSKNMAVIIDWVANHSSWDNAWIINNKSWYAQDANGNIISPPGTSWNDVAQLNFGNAAMRLQMIKSMKYWVLAANIDGFRCDYADGPPSDFWKQAIDTLRNISYHKFLMLAEGSRANNFSVGFDYNFSFAYFEKLKAIYAYNQSALAIDSLNKSEYVGASTGNEVVRYLSNHDVNGSDGTPLDLFGGKKGSMAAFVATAYMKGVPMIYNGQEVGTPIRLTFPFTSTKIDWSLNPDISAEYKKIIAFRNSSMALRRGDLSSYSTQDVIAFTKTIGSEKVFIVANLRNRTINYFLPANLTSSTWFDAINGGVVSLTSQLSMPAFTYLVLKN